jgi:hypothetical protein
VPDILGMSTRDYNLELFAIEGKLTKKQGIEVGLVSRDE